MATTAQRLPGQLLTLRPFPSGYVEGAFVFANR
ncbi:hypothetical protein J3R03_005987 [Actinoplanes couchii]|nr:hypothetical protein [Actinoplanes couchii]